MVTVIIGGGLTGLNAGYYLKDQVIVIEKNETLGGLCSSYNITKENKNYSIEKYYHHFFENDTELMNLCTRFGIAIGWHHGSVGYSFKEKIYPLTTPLEILLYPRLSLIDKFMLGMFTIKCKRVNVEEHVDETAVDYIQRNVGNSVLQKFFMPLLRGKFGDDYQDVSAAWLISRVSLRSNRSTKGEKLGYPAEGFQKLIDCLAASIEKKGGKILTGTFIERIEFKNGAVSSVVTNKGVIKADRVICTSPALTMSMTGMKENAFQGTFCMLFSLKKKLSDIYWINISDNLAFKALIEHTNLIPFERYQENLLYATAYTSKPVNVDQMKEAFISDLKTFGITREDIIWYKEAYDTATAAVYDTHYRYVPYKSETRGLFFAGIFSKPNYPERSINGSLLAGKEVAEMINNG